jgi:hypothetical protein
MSRRFAAFECQKSDLDAPAGCLGDILQALKEQTSVASGVTDVRAEKYQLLK